MKKILFCLLAFISICSVSEIKAQPQYTTPPSSGPKWLNNTPGTELKKAGTCHFIAVGCEAAGVLLISYGLAQAQSTYNATNRTSSAGRGPTTLGSALLITGGIFHLLSWVHISHAGNLMEMKKIVLGGTSNGIGLTYNF